MNQQPYNFINDSYQRNLAGEKLQRQEIGVKNQSMIRGINLANLSSSGFNLINGQNVKHSKVERELYETFKSQIIQPKRPVRIYQQMFYDKFLPDSQSFPFK
jgi:hypothetical protein